MTETKPTQKPVRYKFRARVAQVEQRWQKRHVSGIGETATFVDHNLGYYVRFAGSWEALFVGFDLPDLAVGDTVSIWIEKENDPAPA